MLASYKKNEINEIGHISSFASFLFHIEISKFKFSNSPNFTFKS